MIGALICDQEWLLAGVIVDVEQWLQYAQGNQARLGCKQGCRMVFEARNLLAMGRDAVTSGFSVRVNLKQGGTDFESVILDA